MKTAKYIE